MAALVSLKTTHGLEEAVENFYEQIDSMKAKKGQKPPGMIVGEPS